MGGAARTFKNAMQGHDRFDNGGLYPLTVRFPLAGDDDAFWLLAQPLAAVR